MIVFRAIAFILFLALAGALVVWQSRNIGEEPRSSTVGVV